MSNSWESVKISVMHYICLLWYIIYIYDKYTNIKIWLCALSMNNYSYAKEYVHKYMDKNISIKNKLLYL